MTDTTPMRERLIQAAHKSLGHKQEFRHCTKAYQTEITGIVDAILSVLEETTNGMIAATYPVQAEWEAKDGGYWRIPDCLHSRYWAAMVKAIRGGA